MLFIPLPAMPERHTLDGIHLNAAGYEVWDKAILQGIEFFALQIHLR